MIESITSYFSTADPLSVEMISILIGIGIFVGFINTVAGLATVISYALFMAMGMPVNIANGTTRLGVMSQFAASSLIYKKKGYLDVRMATKVGIPVALGSIVGAEMAVMIDPHAIEISMGIMLPIIALLLILKSRGIIKVKGDFNKRFDLWKYPVFFVIGIYGGFTHAGVGILIILGSFYLLGMDMIRANGIKQFAVLIYTPIALSIFIYYNQVNWSIAVIYAIGNTIGAIVGSKISIKWGAGFINNAVIAVVLLMSFWLIYKQF